MKTIEPKLIRRPLVSVRAAIMALVGMIALSVSGLLVGASDAAAKPRINTIGLKGIAIKGYDPVAYFKDGGPKKGSKEHTLQHAGAEWRFTSAEHKALFTADPGKYMPAYGGYCAYGVAKGALVKIEPDAWSIRDGKLYLNYDQGVQRKWNEKPVEYIGVADRKWPQLVSK